MSHLSEMSRDLGVATAKALPPITVWTLTLNEWVAVATVAYLILQSGYLIWKWRREWVRREPGGRR